MLKISSHHRTTPATRGRDFVSVDPSAIGQQLAGQKLMDLFAGDITSV